MLLPKDATYSSENGDHWSLVSDGAGERIYVRHEAKIPTGWTVTYTDARDFFRQHVTGPHVTALLVLLSQLVT
jgi:hypothetical protein